MTREQMKETKRANKGAWLVLILIVLVSCSKNKWDIPKPATYDNYTLTIDWFTEKDTIFISRYIDEQLDSIYLDTYKKIIESHPNRFLLMCNPYRHFEYWYYSKNGIRLQPIDSFLLNKYFKK